MKLQVTYDSTILPNSYHYLFVSKIKKALSISSPELMDELYRYENKKNKKSKSFTFSVFMEDFERVGEEFNIKGNIKWTISSPDSEFMLYLYNGLLATKNFTYQNYNLTLQNIQLVKEQIPKTNEVLFTTLSPIAIKNQTGRFISPNDEEYEGALNYICDLTLKNIRGEGLKKPLKFIPVDMKKQVVKLKHEEFNALNDKSILYVNAYRGSFKLVGDVVDLQLLSQSGVGYRRSQGFGNIKVLVG
jgi:CRISPR-associated endoribonuclease Cas6